MYIRQTKNDSKDSFIIAEVIRFGRFTTTNLSDENIFSLRQLCRYRKYLVDNISDLKHKTLCVFMMKLILETENQLKILENKIEELYLSLDCTLTSIPGIGIKLAAIIVSEIGDISRFKDAPSLVAFAGIDPTVRQSGTYSCNNNKMSKRGSPYLRRALWTAAKCSYLYDPQLNAYYNKKCEED